MTEEKNKYQAKVPSFDPGEVADMIKDFVEESSEHLIDVEETLLSVDNKDLQQEDIDKLFRHFHTIKGVSGFLNLEDIRELSHETETMLDLARKKELKINSYIVDAIFLVVDAMKKLINLLREQLANEGELLSPYYDIVSEMSVIKKIINSVETRGHSFKQKKVGEILIDGGIIEEFQLQGALERQQQDKDKRRIGEILVDNQFVEKDDVDRALEVQQKVKIFQDTIKIGVKKLDMLVDMVEKLVVVGFGVAKHPDVRKSEDAHLIENVFQLEKVIKNIQSITMSMKTMSIRPVFHKMKRMIRDLCKKMDKNIEVNLIGEDMEADKKVIEEIGNPLMHMVRNCVDHGIESSLERQEKGKDEKGKIELCAKNVSDGVIITVKDDGRGLNKEKIYKKAVDKNLISQGQSISDQELFNFIMSPGFSTAEQVSDVSGRGVGMDVVKEKIEKLNGKIEIKSEENIGTEFIITIPKMI